jgi:hypothetical protein
MKRKNASIWRTIVALCLVGGLMMSVAGSIGAQATPATGEKPDDLGAAMGFGGPVIIGYGDPDRPPCPPGCEMGFGGLVVVGYGS